VVPSPAGTSVLRFVPFPALKHWAIFGRTLDALFVVDVDFGEALTRIRRKSGTDGSDPFSGTSRLKSVPIVGSLTANPMSRKRSETWGTPGFTFRRDLGHPPKQVDMIECDLYVTMDPVVEVRRYATRAGRSVFSEWFAELNNATAKARIRDRIDRLKQGNFGDHRSLGGGLHELRIDWGPGYRIYYAMIDQACVLLLCGGDERKQSSDIEQARCYLQDYRERTRIQ
jgi:putative addiction module killer protein